MRECINCGKCMMGGLVMDCVKSNSKEEVK